MPAPTVAQLIESLREYPDDTRVYLYDREPGRSRNTILEPFGVYEYPNGDPSRCVIAAYHYDAEGDGYSYGDDDEDHDEGNEP
jgi:hypothetical protein